MSPKLISLKLIYFRIKVGRSTWFFFLKVLIMLNRFCAFPSPPPPASCSLAVLICFSISLLQGISKNQTCGYKCPWNMNYVFRVVANHRLTRKDWVDSHDRKIQWKCGMNSIHLMPHWEQNSTLRFGNTHLFWVGRSEKMDAVHSYIVVNLSVSV